MSKDFDLIAFRDFCAGKPAGERYNRNDAATCALAQFGFRDVGASNHAKLGVPAAVYVATVYGDPIFSALASRLSKLIENES